MNTFPLPLAPAHESVRPAFPGLRHAYIFRFVKRVSRNLNKNGEDRILIVTATSAVLADVKGRLRRVVQLADIDRAFFQERQGGARFIFTLRSRGYPLAFDAIFLIKNRAGKGSWSDVLQTFNKLRLAVTADTLPAQRMNAGDDPNELFEQALGNASARLQDVPSEDDAQEPLMSQQLLTQLSSETYEESFKKGPMGRMAPSTKKDTAMYKGLEAVAVDPATAFGERVHPGEWRGEDRLQWCSVRAKPDGEVCVHGTESIMQPHWSCCGRVEEGAPPCMVISHNPGARNAVGFDAKGGYLLDPGKAKAANTPTSGLDTLYDQVRQLSKLPKTAFEGFDPGTGGEGGVHVHFHVADPQRWAQGYTTGSQYATKVPGVPGKSRFLPPSAAPVSPERRRRQSAKLVRQHVREMLHSSASSASTFKPYGDPVPGRPVPPGTYHPPTSDADPLEPPPRPREREKRYRRFRPVGGGERDGYSSSSSSSSSSSGGAAVVERPPRPSASHLLRESEFTFPGSSAGPLQTTEQLLDDMHDQPLNHASLYETGMSHRRVAGAPVEPDLFKRGVEAGWGKAEQFRPPPPVASQHLSEKPRKPATVQTHRAKLRKEGKAIIDSILNGRDPNSDRGSLCLVVLRDNLGTTKRRFNIVEWQGLGPCITLTTMDKGHPTQPTENGWLEYMQCSHLRKAGYSSPDKDTLLLSTGAQHWEIRMSGTAAERWLMVIYDCCHWLRPGADGALYSAPGYGVLPPGTAAPPSKSLPRSPLVVTLPQGGKDAEQAVLQVSPGVHTSLKSETLSLTPSLDFLRSRVA